MGMGGLEQVLGESMWLGAGPECCTQAGLTQERLFKDGGWGGGSHWPHMEWVKGDQEFSIHSKVILTLTFSIILMLTECLLWSRLR